MTQKKLLVGVAAVVVAGIGWALFRPELLFVNQKVNEVFPTARAAESRTALLSGKFRSIAHKTEGTATVYRLADGKRLLRLTGFETSNGPDVHVYLVAAPDAKDNDTVKKAGFVDLGSLKGNQGDQNYDIPTDVDLARYRAVTIWCARFNVNFGTAPLAMAAASAASGSPASLAEGRFHSVAHETEGVATVYEVDGGKRIVRLTQFKTSNGPDVHLYLVAAEDAKDSETVKKAGFVDLGSLKGNEGDQNYDVPAGVDLRTHRAVTVWCKRFGVNFGTASLKIAGS
jgi:electron transfer DM13